MGDRFDMSRPGANNPMMQTFAVTVPAGVGPGQQFQASLDGQLTMVIVPHGSGPSSTLHVQIPVRPSSVQKYAVTIPQGIQPGGRFQAGRMRSRGEPQNRPPWTSRSGALASPDQVAWPLQTRVQMQGFKVQRNRSKVRMRCF